MDVTYVDTLDEEPIYIDYLAGASISEKTDSNLRDSRALPSTRLTLESVKKILQERIRPIRRTSANATEIARLDRPTESICFATWQDYLDYKSSYG